MRFATCATDANMMLLVLVTRDAACATKWHSAATERHSAVTVCHNAATERHSAATERQVPTGELDLMEWLPAFGNPTSLGATTGFHNAVSGACVFNRTHEIC